ncbi:apolipoprotein D-like [Macrobrachium nipponense]|uniref:apolipoprotein D-like n=1 Tax=Macrobrachium nipponense TaxID=159736 RepID=UPI0030C8C976
MSNFFIYIAVTIGVAGLCNGGCPEVKLKENFSPDKYLGNWYEIQSQPSIFQTIKSCMSSSYKMVGDEIQVSSKGLDSSGSPATNTATLSIDPKNPAHMTTDFVPGISPPYDIVDTDYDTFSCIHSCVSIMGMKTEFVFIYSRNRTLNPESVKHCRSIFESYGIDTSGLVDVVQTNCHDHSDL